MRKLVLACLLVWTNVLLYLSPLAAQSQIEPYSFDSNRLGMTLTEFKTAHLPAVVCAQVEADIVSCGYDTGYVDESDPQRRIDLKVTGFFVDSKLAGLWITLFDASGSCFDPHPPTDWLRTRMCRPYVGLFQIFTGRLGPARAIRSALFSQLSALRYENGTSVAEFQSHMCINTAKQGAWFSEVLEERYCDDSKPSGSLAMMAYFDKQSIRTAIARLNK